MFWTLIFCSSASIFQLVGLSLLRGVESSRDLLGFSPDMTTMGLQLTGFRSHSYSLRTVTSFCHCQVFVLYTFRLDQVRTSLELLNLLNPAVCHRVLTVFIFDIFLIFFFPMCLPAFFLHRPGSSCFLPFFPCLQRPPQQC